MGAALAAATLLPPFGASAVAAGGSVLPDGFLGAFFTSDDDVGTKFYVSVDGKVMRRLFSSENLAGRDPSIRYHKQHFYACFVAPKEGGNTFSIAKSRDLVNWTTKIYNVIDREPQTPNVWAPDLFIDDNGAAYVYFAKQRETDPKTGELKFDMYVSATANIESADFGTAIKLNLPPESDSYIDAQVMRFGSDYYMVVKNEAITTNNQNKSPLLLKSVSPMGGFAEIADWPLAAVRGYEGFSIIRENGQVFIYGDNYSHRYDAVAASQHTVWHTDEKNIETGPYVADYVLSDRSLRHGSVIPITDDYAKEVIKQVAQNIDFPVDADDKVTEITRLELNAADYGGVEINKAGDFVIERFAPAPNVVYVVPSKKTITIKNIVNPYGVKDMTVSFKTGAGKIVLPHRTVNGDNKKVDRKIELP